MAKRKNEHSAPRKLDTSGDKLRVLNMQPIGNWPYPRIGVAPLLERAMSHADKVFWPFIGIAQQGAPFFKTGYARTDYKRNMLAVELLKSNLTHVLMLDIDHEHPEDIVQRLAKWVLLDDNVWVVGGLNFRRGAPFEPCAFVYGDDGQVYSPAEWDKGLMEVDVLGTGCILIDRRVFEAIEPPWFAFDYSEVWRNHWPGEDIDFSRRCREADIKLWCDTTTTSPHLIDGKVDESTYRSFLKRNNTPTFFLDGTAGGENVG